MRPLAHGLRASGDRPKTTVPAGDAPCRKEVRASPFGVARRTTNGETTAPGLNREFSPTSSTKDAIVTIRRLNGLWIGRCHDNREKHSHTGRGRSTDTHPTHGACRPVRIAAAPTKAKGQREHLTLGALFRETAVKVSRSSSLSSTRRDFGLAMVTPIPAGGIAKRPP